MKKQIITLTLLLSLCFSAWAQKEYKVAKSTGKLHLNLNGAVIEGYDGNEIIFSSQKTQEEEDERAKGLQAISGTGYKDNTGMGINVTENGQDIHVNMVGNRIDKDLLKIHVPKQFSITFTYHKTLQAELIVINNIKGEIELSTSYNKVKLENNSGPMNIKAIYGSVDVAFENDIKGPVSIISVYDYVDVALPASTKANIELGTSYGKLYAADDFNITVTERNVEKEEGARGHGATAISGTATRTADTPRGTINGAPTPPIAPVAPVVEDRTLGFVYRGSERENIKGTINGGGVDLIFKSNYKNVYLRTR
ncbi:DUF4097 domain-containing protein [Parapedobacter tibetensis]|uniref:DUF4097 domain-containing protein n=1 Tax=Parapedobacter tibetensis TaxID=2972951 RepID=UPI00214DDF2A|nr:DUF4097 domain-containing protein [Parapedobacter tibetensis]